MSKFEYTDRSDLPLVTVFVDQNATVLRKTYFENQKFPLCNLSIGQVLDHFWMFRSFSHATETISFHEKWWYCYLRDGQMVRKWSQMVLDSSLLRELFFEIILKINNLSALRYGLGKLLRRCLGPPSFGGDSDFECSKKYEGPLRYLTTVPFRGGAKKSFTGGSSIFKLTILQYCGGGAPRILL